MTRLYVLFSSMQTKFELATSTLSIMDDQAKVMFVAMIVLVMMKVSSTEETSTSSLNIIDESSFASQCSPCLPDERQLNINEELKTAEVAMWSGGVVVPSMAFIVVVILNMLKQRALRQQQQIVRNEENLM